MLLKTKLKRYRFPIEIISYVVWEYHRFNDSYRDMKERLLYRGIVVSHETIRSWCLKFGPHFFNVIKKREATRRKEKCLIKFKSPKGTQHTLSLMGKTRNIFAVAVGRYANSAEKQRVKFSEAKAIWEQAANEMLCA